MERDLNGNGGSTYLKDLDAKIAQLSAMKYDGREGRAGGGGGAGSPQASIPYGVNPATVAGSAHKKVVITPSLPASFRYDSDDDD